MFSYQKTATAVIDLPEERCPFLAESGDRCQATLAGVKVSWRRDSTHCNSGDYDACNRFLARVLQGSQSRSTKELWSLRQK